MNHRTRKWIYLFLILGLPILVFGNLENVNISCSKSICANRSKKLSEFKFFKYVDKTLISSTLSPPLKLNKSISQRSLIRNSFFNFKNKSPKVEIRNETKPVNLKNASERPRRSPYDPFFQRAPLYHSPPIPVQDHFNEYGSQPTGFEEGSVNFPRFSRPPRKHRPHPHPGRRNPAPRYGRPPPPPRRVVINHRGPIPRPRSPIPIPLPSSYGHPRIRDGNPGYSYPKDAANIQDILSYFQKEENEQPSPPLPYNNRPPPLNPPPPDLSSVSMGGDFSKELHDVQTSLLKDIREFAQRPNIMSSTPTLPSPITSAPTNSPPIRSGSSSYRKRVPIKEIVESENDDHEFEEDDVLEPKPKPVRDLIKETTPIPLPKPKRIRWRPKKEESEEEPPSNHRPVKHRHEHQYNSDREHDSEDDRRITSGSHERNHRQKAERHSYSSSRGNHDTSGGRIRTHVHDEEESEEYDENNRPRSSSRSKYSYKNRSKYRNSRERERDEEDRDRYKNHRYPMDDRKDNNRYIPRVNPTPTPIVLKRPYGPYKSEIEALEPLEMQKRSKYWNSREDSLAFPPTVPTTSSTHHRSRYTLHPSQIPPNQDNRYSHSINQQQDLLEDIVEIHTPIVQKPSALPFREEQVRRDHLHKLYLEYLERKLEAETLAAAAAAAVTTPKPLISPMRMKIHIYPNEMQNTDIRNPERNYNYYQPQKFMQRSTFPPPTLKRPPPYSTAYDGSSSNINQNHHHRMDSYSFTPGPVPSGGTYVPSPTRFSTLQSKTTGDKNKNVVLHLHVHRRNDEADSIAGASEVHTTTVKPLTYKEIYDQVQEQQQQNQRKYFTDPVSEGAINKSLSMEVPLQEEKIEDVIHSLLKFRQRRNIFG